MVGDDLVRLGGAIMSLVLEDQCYIKIFKRCSNIGTLVGMKKFEMAYVEMMLLRWIPL